MIYVLLAIFYWAVFRATWMAGAWGKAIIIAMGVCLWMWCYDPWPRQVDAAARQAMERMKAVGFIGFVLGCLLCFCTITGMFSEPW